MSTMAKRTRTGDLSHPSVEALEEGHSRRACHVRPLTVKVKPELSLMRLGIKLIFVASR